MQTKRNGLILAGLGVLVILFAILAHAIGIGHAGFGIKHVAVLVVGVVLLAVGAVVAWRAQAAGTSPASPSSSSEV